MPFLDTYVADKTDGDLSNLEHFNKKINKKYHEGPVAFNKAGDMMVFTRKRICVCKTGGGHKHIADCGICFHITPTR